MIMGWEIMIWMILTMLNKRWTKKNKIDFLKSCYFVSKELVQLRTLMDMMFMLKMKAIVKTVLKIFTLILREMVSHIL